MGDKIIVIPKPDTVSWEDITRLLHDSFKVRAEQGLNYMACNQSVNTTIKRVGNGICLVAMINDKLVGTATLHIIHKKGKVYGNISQDAVSPKYQGMGGGNKLEKELIRICYENKMQCVYTDTAEKASDVVEWRLRHGWQIIKLTSHSFTNYYTVVFRLPICGRHFSKLEARLRFFLSSFVCRLLLREDGKYRSLVILLKKAKRICKKLIWKN